MMSVLEGEGEVLLLKNLEDKLVTVFLKKIDSRDLSDRLNVKCVIAKEVQEKFSNLDDVNLKEELKIRYLLQHIYNAVKDNNHVLNSFVALLTEIDEGMARELNKELCQYKVIGDSQAGTSEAVVGSKRPRASIGEVSLCESDVKQLTELLTDDADKAEELGVALGLSKAQRMESLKGCSLIVGMSNIILEWIRTQHEPRTLNDLRIALASDTVGLKCLAFRLEKNFIIKVQKNVCKKRCMDVKLHSTYRSGDITINRGKAALLGFQMSSLHPVQYKWRKNGQFLSEGEIYSGTTKPFLYINFTEENVQGQYECAVEDGQRQHHEQMKLSFYSGFKKHFSDVYKVQKEVLEENSCFPSTPDIFINLAIISKKKNFKNDVAYAVQGDIDDILEGKEKVEYADLFGQYKSKSLLLVEGRPGSGKTTLMHKVSRDWALDKGILEGADIIVLISIRLLDPCSKNFDLSKLFEGYVHNESERSQILKYFEKVNGLGVCFIFDGLDEYKDNKNYNNIILKLITKRVWPLAMIIVASRPVGTALLRNKGPEKTNCIEVLGFKTDEISKYVYSYFKESYEKAAKLILYLKSHVNVYRMCYLPVHAAMICILYDEEGENIPQTESKIYENFARFALARKNKESREIDSLQDLTENVKEYFTKICKLAFDMIAQSKQVMLQSQTKFPLTPSGSDESSLGLVTIDIIAKLFGMKDLYAFLHLTFQEYLAAFYLSQLVIRKTQELNVNLQMVWKFYSGIVQFDSDSLILESVMSDSKTDLLYKVQWKNLILFVFLRIPSYQQIF